MDTQQEFCEYSWIIPLKETAEVYFWSRASTIEEAHQDVLKKLDATTYDYSRNTLINYFDSNNKQYTMEEFIIHTKPSIYYKTNDNYDNDDLDDLDELGDMSEDENSHYDDY
jgi:hypothetical protein